LDRLDTLAPEPHGSRQWPPEVVFFAVDLTQDEGERLRELMQEAPSAAVVTVGADLGQAAIEARAGTIDATLAPSGMPIQVQHLSPEEYAEIVEVLGASYVPGPAWTSNLADAREPVIADLPDPDPTERLESLIEPESLFEVEHTVPQVRVLGPVELVGADTAVLSGTVGHLHAAVEMTAYLAMNDGATTEQFAAALWPNQSIKPATRHSAVSRTRRLLGINTEGAWRLSTVTDGAGGPIKRYHLTEVGSDWGDFNRLRGSDPSSTPLPDLRRALMLVRGVPFSQVRDGVGRVRANRYLWSDTLAVEMTASVIDVACEAARRALLEGKPGLAAEAADAGLRASTDHERLWRYAIRARVLMGEHAAATELMEALTQRLTELDVDPEPETNMLLDQASAAIDQAAS
ncbi:AfsR/SARP family transcriptional regulator, partial [Pseudactinotalea sp.]|uniref:AfsR/SARP family transcriptional regulator n=1 Tax=Pseudactinotalea sp. TaxID=1926260 RepID=UPI003B3ADE07